VGRDPSTVAEAAQAVRRLVTAIEKGEIDADSPKARALQRRLEGVVAAWEVAVGRTEEWG
jgi:transcription elongation GreA/GreB family factor